MTASTDQTRHSAFACQVTATDGWTHCVADAECAHAVLAEDSGYRGQVGAMRVRPGFELTVDELLGELRCRGWTLVRWGPKDLPVLLAATFRWVRAADVLILRGEDDASAYRVPLVGGDEGIWNPRVVNYQFHSCALWTLRAILTIEEPGSTARDRVEPAAAACSLPSYLPRPVLIRPLSPHPR